MQIIIIIIIINNKKRTCKIVDFAVPADHRIKLKEWVPARELKKLWNIGDNYTNRDWCFWYSHQSIIKETGEGLGSWWTSGDLPNYSIIENVQDTEKSPGDLRRLAVTQTPVKDYQLKLMWKIPKEKMTKITCKIVLSDGKNSNE